MRIRQNLTMSRRAFLGAATAGAGGLMTTGCRVPRESTSGRPQRFFLITMDTLRADHLKCYGYPRNTSPFLTYIAGRSAIGDYAIASSSHTAPAHASIFTGLHLPQHKLLHNAIDDLPESIFTMAQMFQDLGYDTAGFSAVPWLESLNRGFTTFRAPVSDVLHKAERMVDDAVEWLSAKTSSDSFFMWLHLFDPHWPYEAPRNYLERIRGRDANKGNALLDYWTKIQHKSPIPEPWAGDTRRFIRTHDLYDAEIRYMDSQIKRVFQFSANHALNRNSVWLFTADHGQGFGDHGYYGHGKRLYTEQLRVPFIIHSPDNRIRATTISPVLQHVDILPTFADMAGASLEKQTLSLSGTSLLPLLEGRGELPARYAFAQRRKKYDGHPSTLDWEDGPIYALLDRDTKYIVHTHGDDEYYDLARDPFELQNLAGSSAAAEAMQQKALAEYASMVEDAKDIQEGELSDKYEDVLTTLGYIG